MLSSHTSTSPTSSSSSNIIRQISRIRHPTHNMIPTHHVANSILMLSSALLTTSTAALRPRRRRFSRNQIHLRAAAMSMM